MTGSGDVVRRALVMLLVTMGLGLAIAGCTTGTANRRTVTVLNTITGASPPPGAPDTIATATPITNASSAGRTVRPLPTPTSPATRTTTAATATATAPLVKVNPLVADCPTTMDAQDVDQTIGAVIGDGAEKRTDVANPDRGITGKIRCYYPTAGTNGAAPVVIALTQYSSAAAAGKQIDTTIAAEVDAGAITSKPKVNGYPAEVLLRSGGLLLLRYGTWTLSIAVADKLASNGALTHGLPILAGRVLARILKND